MEAELRVGATFRSKLVEEQGAIRNQMIRWLDRYFPEFSQVFPSFGKMALAVLEYTPFPSDLAGKELEEVLALYRQSQGLQSPQRPDGIGPTLHWRNERATDGPYRNCHACPPVPSTGRRNRGTDRATDRTHSDIRRIRMAEDCSELRRCDHRRTVIRDREFLPLSGSAAAYQISGPDTAGSHFAP